MICYAGHAALCLLLFNNVVFAGTDSPHSRFERIASRMVKAINEQNHPTIQQDFGDVMLKAFSLDKSKPFFTNLVGQYGTIEKLGKARYVPPNQSIFPTQFQRGKLDLKLVLDSQDTDSGFFRSVLP